METWPENAKEQKNLAIIQEFCTRHGQCTDGYAKANSRLANRLVTSVEPNATINFMATQRIMLKVLKRAIE